jgi:glycosyltransferase involved in cell wall biosynthesis
MPNRLAVVIPAYRPSEGLIDLVRKLTEKRLPGIVIVDDGSGPEFRETFAQASAFPNVELLRHAVNLGKGAALKTAFNHVLCTIPDLAGVVTADADGQHHPDDIERVAAALLARPDSLVLGARAFDGDVPLRSKIGNVATRGLMHALLGQKLTDTQTGLRGIPATLLPRLLRLEATGYEFELEMLIAAHQLAVPVVEETIQTIYEQGNPSSHFNPLIDSMKIYFVLLRFGSVSMMSALLDNLIFILTVHRFGSILASQVLSRAFSVAFNYGMVRSSVFYSKQRHQAVLPKYIALTIVSGSCSYAGIRLLSTRYGVGVVAAKLLVETFLFFVNFAVQRAFIFKPQSAAEPAETPQPLRVHPFAIALGALFVALLGLEAYGLRTSGLFTQDLWYPAGIRRFERYAEVYAILSAILIFAAPRYFAGVFAALLVLLTAFSVGPVPLLAAAFFFLSANALGSKLLGRTKSEAVEDQVCAMLLGTGIYTFTMTLVARLPVNYPAVWAVVLAAPLLIDPRATMARFANWVRLLRPPRAPSLAQRGGLAVLLFVLIAHWFVALKPETTADGLAMHLSIPANIAMNHQFTMEPWRFLWAVMPMAADFSYAIVYLLGGEYGARLVVFAMLLAACALLYCGLRRWTTPTVAYLLTAAFAATPIVQLVTGALFVENFLAAMILALLTAIWRFGDTGDRRYFYLAMALGGTAMTVKFGALAFVAMALPFAFVEARRHWKRLGPHPAGVCALGVALLLAMAAPPFAVAYVKTRNPLFPFLNEKFHSPYLPADADIRDGRFKRTLSARTPYDITFHTEAYYEGQRGSLGFLYLAFVPLGLLGFAVARRRPAVSAAVVALGAGAVILCTEPNARYLYAAMPLALIPVGATLAWTAEHQRGLYRTLIGFLLGGLALNLYFLPASSYYHKDFALKQPFARAERDRYLREAAPIRKVIEYFNKAHPKERVLLTHEGANAGLNADIYENHWHQIDTYLKLRAAADVPGVLGLINGWKVRYFIGRKPAPGELAEPPALAGFMAACTLPEFEVGDAYLARLDPGCGARSITEPVIAVQPGYYDDWDPALVYQGVWTQESGKQGPDRATRTYAETPGAQVTLAFEGRALYYVYTRGPNGGIASVTIDGVARDPIDQYYEVPDWQHKTGYCCFGPGRHVIVVRATGDKNPASSGYALDLDSFSVVD